MTDKPSIEDRLYELEGSHLGLQLGLQNLVIAICASGSIDVAKVADAYNQLSDETRDSYGLSGKPAGVAMDNIGKNLKVAGSVIEKELKNTDHQDS